MSSQFLVALQVDAPGPDEGTFRDITPRPRKTEEFGEPERYLKLGQSFLHREQLLAQGL